MQGRHPIHCDITLAPQYMFWVKEIIGAVELKILKIKIKIFIFIQFFMFSLSSQLMEMVSYMYKNHIDALIFSTLLSFGPY